MYLVKWRERGRTELEKIEAAINFVDYCTPAETNEDVELAGIAIEALEKQIPKKPLAGIDFMGNEFRICCKCSAIVKDGEWRANYCPDCGQAIDWSENNE